MPGRKRKQVNEEDNVTNKQESKEPAKMTVAELRKELQARGLDTSGKKAELVPRLEEALKDIDEAEAGPSEIPPSAKKAKTDSTDDGDKKEDVLQKEEETTDYGKAVAKLKSGEKKQRVPKVDQMVPGSHGYTVVDDWDCMLNQTNIGQNNNKFYIIQMLLGAFQAYYVWTRWGRVGESGQNAMKGPFRSIEEAAKDFKKKFTDKTRNKWEDRAQFTPVAGKYTLLEMDDDDDDDMGGTTVKGDEPDAPPKIVRQCSLEKPTQELVRMIFDNDMFNNAMQKLELDTKKMPLGKLSKSQIAKGFEVLEEIEPLIAKSSAANRKKLQELSSRFYTIVPHDFGRRVPPVIDDEETLRKKFDMLLVLGDIEIAQTMKKDQEEASQQQGELEEVPHPLDINYETLQARLSHIPPSDKNHQLIQNYINATIGTWRKPKLLELWEVDRIGEDKRFASHDHLVNRRLLWHGTNVAVVAAILKSGLRIMPHSGGCVGKGIYFASENSKSAAYVGTTNDDVGVMFLGEVALGRERHINHIDTSLTRAPDGYDSIVARGRTEPDPKDDATIILDGKEVAVPQGKPISMPKYSNSTFPQSEYLIYKESQCRLRYLLKMKFH